MSRGRVLPVIPGSSPLRQRGNGTPKMAVKGTSSNDKCWRPQLFVVPQTHEILLFYKEGESRDVGRVFEEMDLDGREDVVGGKLPPGDFEPVEE